MTYRIGIISDTHGLLKPIVDRSPGRRRSHRARRRTSASGHPRRASPHRQVTAIRGNVDTGDWAVAYAYARLVCLAGRLIFVLHDLKTLRINPVERGIDVVISGHSHVSSTIDVTPDGLRTIIHDLGERDSLPECPFKAAEGPDGEA